MIEIDGPAIGVGSDGTTNSARPDQGERQDAPPAATVSRRDAGILAAAVTAVPLVIAGIITIIPQFHGLWPTALAAAVVAGIVVMLAALIVRSTRAVLIAQGADTEIVAYKDDRDTGILYKGKIENVALRVETIHLIVDQLTRAIPEDQRREALYKCGHMVGQNWVPDFHKQLPRLQIKEDDVLRQMLKWSEYDATAGMGRLSVAVDPATGKGLVTLSNSFLSRSEAGFPLDWWFAGYLAGSLTALLKKKVDVAVCEESHEITPMTFFQVAPGPVDRLRVSSVRRPPHPASRARGRIWIEKLRRPLPDEKLADSNVAGY